MVTIRKTITMRSLTDKNEYVSMDNRSMQSNKS